MVSVESGDALPWITDGHDEVMSIAEVTQISDVSCDSEEEPRVRI